jgi:hypothetical protein
MNELKELKRDMDQWLSAPNPSDTHNRLQEEHHEGTGNWFLETTDFTTWRDTPGGMLWIKGIRESTRCVISHPTLTGQRQLATGKVFSGELHKRNNSEADVLY